MKRVVFFLLMAVPASADLIGLELIGPGGFSVFHDGHWDHLGIHTEHPPMAVPEASPMGAVAAAGAAMVLRRKRRQA